MYLLTSITALSFPLSPSHPPHPPCIEPDRDGVSMKVVRTNARAELAFRDEYDPSGKGTDMRLGAWGVRKTVTGERNGLTRLSASGSPKGLA